MKVGFVCLFFPSSWPELYLWNIDLSLFVYIYVYKCLDYILKVLAET